jgi:hypothetical protein
LVETPAKDEALGRTPSIDQEAAAERAKAQALMNEEHAKLGIKSLKELLTSAGVNFAGATEKDDLVRLLTKSRSLSALNEIQMVWTFEWQRVPEGVALQPGLEIKFDMAKGCNFARLMSKEEAPPKEVAP